MNDSLDSISSFFNKLFNMKSKDSSSSSSSREQLNTVNHPMNKATNQPTNQPTNQSIDQSKLNNSKDHPTNKTALNFLKTGLSDILDETNSYLNSIKINENCPNSATSSKNVNKTTLRAVQSNDENLKNVQIAIDLTNEQDLKCFLNDDIKCSENRIKNENSKILNESMMNRSLNELKIRNESNGQNNLANKPKRTDNLAEKSFEEMKNLSITDKANESSMIQIKELNEDKFINNQTESSIKNRTNEEQQSTNNESTNIESTNTESSNIESSNIESSNIESNPKLNEKINEKINEKELNKESNESLDNRIDIEKSVQNDVHENVLNYVPPALVNTIKTFEEINLECINDAKEEEQVNDQIAIQDEFDQSESAQFPAKIFFQKSSKSDSSESKSKIKNSILSVIKSDKSKSNAEKCSTKSKSNQIVRSLEPELLVNDEFMNKVSNNQNLNKVKKSSSFSSTNSLATSSSSDNNLNCPNKENDCELNNLISEFSNSFNAYKGTYLSNQNVQNVQINESDNGEISRTKVKLVKQQSLDETSNSSTSSSCNPPKPPSRIKSLSKLNKVQRDSNGTLVNDSNELAQNTVKCSTIQIINQSINYSPITTDQIDEFKVQNNLTTNSDCSILNDLKTEKTNKLTISVQANDNPIKLEEQTSKLINCDNDYQLTNMKSELISNGNEIIKIETDKQQTNNGLWSNDNLNKSKRSKSVKQLTSRDFKACSEKLLNYELSIKQPKVIKKSNTMQFDSRSINVLDKSLLDKSLVDKNKSKLPIRISSNSLLDKKIQEKRSVDESINKLVNKSINRLTVDRSVKNKLPYDTLPSIRAPNETVLKNKSCSFLNQCSTNQMTSSLTLPNQTIKKSKIPYSKSSVTLSRFDNQSNSDYLKNRILTNCLDVSSLSSSSCSLCTSISDDSLESSNKSKTSSLSNLDHNFENSKIKTSNSMSKIGQKLESLMNERSIRINNHPFKDGTRSLSNLTSYNLVAHANKRLLKTNSNYQFHIDRELSRIDETVDDDQEQIKQKTVISNQFDNLVSDSKSNRTNQTIDSCTNYSIISSSLDNLHGCMDESNRSTNTQSSNLCSSKSNVSSNNLSMNTPTNIPINTPINRSSFIESINTSSKPSINQFKSSLINQLIDSNSHLKANLGLGQSNLDEESSIKENNETSLENLNETQKSIFNSKKSLFAKNRSLMNKTDSCKSFELNERIVDLEMQLNSHKTKFNESLNLIKLLSEHCNDLIEVFNETYNCKLKEIGELVNENQRLIELNDEYKIENLNLNETCNDLRKHLNQELNQNCSNQDNLKSIKNFNLNQEQKYTELEERYNKLKNALDYSRDNEQQLTDELNNLKVKFQLNSELYERVKNKALEKVESANKLIENANKNNERELQLAKMKIIKTEQAYTYKIAKLESELELKTKENYELNQLLDGLK